jgi:hypothetical protein
VPGLQVHSADCPRLSLHAVRGLIRRLNAGDGCRYCTAYEILKALVQYVSAVSDPPDNTAALINKIAEILKTEPGPTTCWACQRARRNAHLPHSGHALCPRHSA